MVDLQTLSFTLDTELTPIYYRGLLTFIDQSYLKKDGVFHDVKIFKREGENVLTFISLDKDGKWSINVEIVPSSPIRVKMSWDQPVPNEILNRLKEDLFINVEIFEAKVRKATLYFTWVEGQEIIPERLSSGKHKLIYRMFSESMLLFYVIFIVASVFLFYVFGSYTPIFLVVSQFFLVLFSGKIIGRTGDWQITEKNPNVHILQYQLPIEDQKSFLQKFGRDALVKIKKEIYDRTLAVGKALDCDIAGQVLSKYELKCTPEEVSTKVVNVYDIVKKGAERFNFKVPKIVVSNTTIPNAAASGPGHRLGVMVITTGLLTQLNDDEILGVVGHELSHMKGMDTLAFFALMSTQYFLNIYLLWPFIMFFGLFYLFFAFTVVYFIAKFFESKADLESAIRIGQPKILAEALRKIGFVKLIYERSPSYRFQEWLVFDPHPPIYFRVSRLEQLKEPEKLRHPLIESIKDNIKAFLSSFK